MRQLLPRAPAAGRRRCLAAAAASMSSGAAATPAPPPPSARAANADAEAAAAATHPKKPTLVCLHGYLQNAALFRTRTGSLRKGIKSRAGDFVYVDAPYFANEARTVVWVGGGGGDDEGGEQAAGGGADDAAAAAAADAAAAAASSGSATDNEMDGAASGGRSWFCWEEVRQRAPRGAAPGAQDAPPPPPPPTTRPSHATRYTGWEASFQAIAAALKAKAAAPAAAPAEGEEAAAPSARQAAAATVPLGLVGFSQGAAAGALFLSDLAERQARGECRDVPFPAFAVLCAGFLPRDAACAGLIQRQRAGRVPVLVVTGEQDKLVPRERSDALVAALRGGDDEASLAREWLHPGGHLLPTCSGAFKETLVAFLDEAEAKAAAEAGATR